MSNIFTEFIISQIWVRLSCGLTLETVDFWAYHMLFQQKYYKCPNLKCFWILWGFALSAMKNVWYDYKVQKKAIKGNVKLASRDVSRCDWFQYMKRWKKCTLEPTVKSIMDAVLLSRSPYVQHVKSGIWKLPVQHGLKFFGSECHAEVFFNLGQHESPPTPTWATNLCDLLTTSFAYTVRGMGMCVGVDGLPLSISIARQAWSSGTFTVNEESVCVMKWSLDWWNHPPYN